MLVKNGDNIFIAYDHQPTHSVQTSNSAKLLLEVGDVVYLNLWRNARVFDDLNHPTTFSGHLLFTVSGGNQPGVASADLTSSAL